MRALKPSLYLLCLLFLQACNKPLSWNATDITGMMPDLEFSLTGPDGQTVSAASLRGKPVLIFFGFTHCPDVCPTTLTQLAMLRKDLAKKADKIQVVLVSVDPDRDSPDVLKRYTGSFGPWLLGLTGPEESLSTLREAYGVYAAMESSDSKGAYNIMHNAAVFGFDKNGHARILMTDLGDKTGIVADLEQLIDQ